MEERTLHTILIEFQKLNKHLTHMEEEQQNKFDLIDARFNTLEGIIVTMQNDTTLLQNKMTCLKTSFETALQEIQSRMVNFETTLQEIQDKMANFEATLQEIQGRMTNFEATLQEIGHKMIEFDARLASLEKVTLRMEYDFNDKISALFDAYSYHNDQYQKLEKRIRQNEVKIANLSLSSC